MGPHSLTHAMPLRRLDPSANDFHPAYVVWELTLRCDQPCTHCGSQRFDQHCIDESLEAIRLDLAAIEDLLRQELARRPPLGRHVITE